MSDLFPAGDTTSALESAVASMSDADASSLDFGGLVETPRDESGKFTKPEPEAEAKAEPEDKAKDEKEPAEAEAAADDADEDYIELPPDEEGKEPSKLKLTEVLDGYKRSQTLAQELEQVRKSAPMPAEIEREIGAQVQARQQLMAVVQELYQATQPVAPDLDLTNPNSPKFNPTLFHEQAAAYQQKQYERQQLQQAYAQAQKEQAEQQGVIAQARYQREMAKALEFWPELKDKATANQVVDGVTKNYGFTLQEVQAIEDARVLAVLKDALAYRNGKAAQETAVKVVKAKPKLVRATARQSAGGRTASAAQHMERLGKTGSMDDAVAALAQLL